MKSVLYNLMSCALWQMVNHIAVFCEGNNPMHSFVIGCGLFSDTTQTLILNVSLACVCGLLNDLV